MVNCLYCGRGGNEDSMLGVKMPHSKGLLYAHPNCAKKAAKKSHKRTGYRGE